jgi:CBS domain-containing protein
VPELVTVSTHQKVGEAIDLMQRYGISQIPVVRNGDEAASLADVVGSIRESGLLDRVFRTRTRSRRTSPPRWSRRSRCRDRRLSGHRVRRPLRRKPRGRGREGRPGRSEC